LVLGHRNIAAGRADIGIVAGTVDPAAELETFDLIDLRLFLHIAEAGSITRGALARFPG
jgi:hypothetical protein